MIYLMQYVIIIGYADGRKTLETYHGRVVENAKSKDIVILDRPLTVTHGHNKGK